MKQQHDAHPSRQRKSPDDASRGDAFFDERGIPKRSVLTLGREVPVPSLMCLPPDADVQEMNQLERAVKAAKTTAAPTTSGPMEHPEQPAKTPNKHWAMLKSKVLAQLLFKAMMVDVALPTRGSCVC